MHARAIARGGTHARAESDLLGLQQLADGLRVGGAELLAERGQQDAVTARAERAERLADVRLLLLLGVVAAALAGPRGRALRGHGHDRSGGGVGDVGERGHDGADDEDGGPGEDERHDGARDPARRRVLLDGLGLDVRLGGVVAHAMAPYTVSPSQLTAWAMGTAARPATPALVPRQMPHQAPAFRSRPRLDFLIATMIATVRMRTMPPPVCVSGM